MDNKTINEYIDILAHAEIEQNTSAPAYFKANAYQNAANIVMILAIAYEIDKVLSVQRIQSLNFHFSEEYDDNGGTYLSVNGEVAYSKNGETHEEAFYDGEPDFIRTLTDSTEDEDAQLQEVFYALWKEIENVGDDEYYHSPDFFNEQFTKQNSAVSVFRRQYADQMALIEKVILQNNVSDTDKPSSSKLKM